MFSRVAAAVGAVRDRGGTPDVQLRGFAQAVVAEAAARPHFPPMWLREIAEGGRHLDDETLREMKRVVGTMAAILADGRRSGAFADVHPLVAHIGIVAPILFFAALGPARDRLGDLLPAGRALPSPDDVTGFVVDSTLAALAAPAAAGRRPPLKRSARR
jgi:hypothetical protein